MPDLEQLVEVALGSELFSAPHLEADLTRFMGDGAAQMRELAARCRAAGTQQMYFVGSGGSWASMWSGKLLCDRFVPVAADVSLSYDLIWRAPRRLGPDAVVFVASYSGQTEDTLEALRFAKSRGARTVALVGKADTLIGAEADEALVYASPGLYSLPLAAVTTFVCEWGRLEGDEAAAGVLDALAGIPAQVGEAFVSTRARGRELALELASSELIYCLAAGPLYGLAYKFGLTVFMENMRVHSSVIESTEFRHGPAEMLDRHSPDMIFLLGQDGSRTISERSARVAAEHGARVRVFDAYSHPDVHPLLQPFVFKVALQWFIVYSTLVRGISDLDDRALMGHQVLSGAGWP
ncbi:MAG TPA: SIS domain-containing protein [Gaiellales bacterium]|jgi:fructoselysine-6-P-deglycase FrlB-like protein